MAMSIPVPVGGNRDISGSVMGQINARLNQMRPPQLPVVLRQHGGRLVALTLGTGTLHSNVHEWHPRAESTTLVGMYLCEEWLQVRYSGIGLDPKSTYLFFIQHEARVGGRTELDPSLSIQVLRTGFQKSMEKAAAIEYDDPSSEIIVENTQFPARDGTSIPLRIYRPALGKDDDSRPVILQCVLRLVEIYAWRANVRVVFTAADSSLATWTKTERRTAVTLVTLESS
jgi:hypothetical protein